MLNLFKPKSHQQKSSGGPSIDGVNINSQKVEIATQNTQSENNFLEIKIISSSPNFQEIEITCGKKKIRRKIYKNFLPIKFSSNFTEGPSSSLGAINLNSLSQKSNTNNLVFKEKLLNALAKINLLNQASKVNGSINYQKIWDGEKLNIDHKFSLLSNTEKQQVFAQENANRENYLTTPDKAILLAAFNIENSQNNKIDRNIISQSFAELANNNSFKNFIAEAFFLIENKAILLQKFFTDAAKNSTSEKTKILFANLDKIFSEPNKEARHQAIKTFKNLTSQKTDNNLAK